MNDDTETEKDSEEDEPIAKPKKRGGRQLPESENEVAQSAPVRNQKEKPKL